MCYVANLRSALWHIACNIWSIMSRALKFLSQSLVASIAMCSLCLSVAQANGNGVSNGNSQMGQAPSPAQLGQQTGGIEPQFKYCEVLHKWIENPNYQPSSGAPKDNGRNVRWGG